MSEKLSRRDFLKLATAGAATTAVLTGCGPASRYVTREPYTKMPEYTYNGLSTYYATTCRECSAGCGLIVRTMQGRALKVEGNPSNPVNLGKTCARGQATLHGLYNPDRVENPLKQGRASELAKSNIVEWDNAISVVSDALSKHAPNEVAFLMGLTPDHLFDLISDLTSATGMPAPIRFGALSMFEARATLSKAAENLFGQLAMPYFDIGSSDYVLSFGANFLETWLSPVAQTREYAQMRRGNPKVRGYFVQLEARMSQTAAKADEWIPVLPGTEGQVVLAIGKLVAQAKGIAAPDVFGSVDPVQVSQNAGVDWEALKTIAEKIASAQNPVVIPGGSALGQSNGLFTAEAILALNALLDNYGKTVFTSTLSPNQDEYHRPASPQEMTDLIGRMKSSAIKVLFIHGVNPVFELPKSLGFADAMKNVEMVVSFATFPDETALMSDYIFPDHHGLESWGYQRIATGTSQSVLSGAQPTISPFYNTRATADVLISAANAAGGNFAAALSYQDEVNYIQSKLTNLMDQTDGSFAAADINSFAAYFQQHGGWWRTAPSLGVPSGSTALGKTLKESEAQPLGNGDFFFLPFVSPTLGEAGANKPWLQELGDPTTTVMWNTWIEINPQTADKLGIDDDDVVRVVSETGVPVEASVYRYPAIHPDVIAIPFGQGHTAYGEFAAGRGVNPADLLGAHFNEAGDLAFAGMKVKLEKTGKKKQLSRFEGKLGVYGFTK